MIKTIIEHLTGKPTADGANALRAAVLGSNDGLVSNLDLVMGVAGVSQSVVNALRKKLAHAGQSAPHLEIAPTADIFRLHFSSIGQHTLFDGGAFYLEQSNGLSSLDLNHPSVATRFDDFRCYGCDGRVETPDQHSASDTERMIKAAKAEPESLCTIIENMRN